MISLVHRVDLYLGGNKEGEVCSSHFQGQSPEDEKDLCRKRRRGAV